ncbi:sensor histidine kinase [Pelagerythrobacter marinus]|uniref:sensor histidine kinase n=1 Tax=Pelagerythrobacter marinus TaxID=538382 RepID=UPI0020376822|nr:histidine kinase [Pelagerythrobacter marinus]USA39307.1 histidine kinase [Pelagerythrobacter marinus]WPZ06552.1 histidine kinase [Pelagerythrobacter marinus]
MAETVPADERARVPVVTVLASMAGLWLCYFLLTTLRAAIVGFEPQVELLWRRGLVTLVGIGMTVLLWIILRLFDNRPLWAKILAAVLVAVPIAVPIAQTNQWIFADMQRKVEENFGRDRGINIRRDEAGNLLVDIPPERFRDLTGLGVSKDAAGAPASVMIAPAPSRLDQWLQVVDIALGRYFLLLAWASLYFAMLAGAQARAAERREERFRSAAKAAELRSLRYQVNPHFLFNTLNSLSSLVMTGKADRAETMIQSIASFYRHSLAEDPTSDVPLEDEFELQRQYLAIESVRFPDRLEAVFDLPTDLAEARVPGMILQPLVENSVRYAVAPHKVPVTIRIAAREDYGRLAITVEDDGPGAPASAGQGFGIGLANVRDRLQARFGREASVTSGPVEGGYLTEIRIPLVKHG